jgi:hypothetical protein
MALAIVVIPLALLWNVVLLSAMAAGRSTIIWRRRLWTTIEISLIALGVGLVAVFAPLAVNAETKGTAKVGIALAFGFAIVVGTLFTYLEYAAAGRRDRFRPDLKTSLWFGQRSGAFLDGR